MLKHTQGMKVVTQNLNRDSNGWFLKFGLNQGISLLKWILQFLVVWVLLLQWSKHFREWGVNAWVAWSFEAQRRITEIQMVFHLKYSTIVLGDSQYFQDISQDREVILLAYWRYWVTLDYARSQEDEESVFRRNSGFRGAKLSGVKRKRKRVNQR